MLIKNIMKKKMFKKINDKILRWIVFSFSLVILLSVFTFCFLKQGEAFMVRSDSPGYIQISRNIIDYGVFSRSSELPLIVDSFRTPLYPLFLSFFYIFTNSLFVVGIVQCILLSLSLVLVLEIGKLVGNRKIGILASLLFGLDFYNVVSSGFIKTESLFIPIFFVFVYNFILFLKKDSERNLIYSGLFLGLSALVRPSVIYFLLGLIVFYLIVCLLKKKSFLIFLRRAFIIFITFILIISPWLIRNKLVFDKMSLSSIKEYNFYFWNLSTINSEQKGVSKDDIRGVLSEEIMNKFNLEDKLELSSFELGSYYKEESMKVLKGNKLNYIKEHILGSSYFMISNYYRKTAYALTGNSDADIPIYDIMDIVKNRDFYKIKDILFNGGFPLIMMIIGFGISFVYLLFLLINLLFVFKSKNIDLELFLYIIVGYFAVITGPLGSGSYRHPVLPFIIILAIIGFFRFKSYIKNKV